MIAIFYTEKEAVEFSDKVHKFLQENRKDYRADIWSTIEKAEKEDKWAVKIPDDYQRWPVKMSISTTVKEQIVKYPIDWKT